MRSFCSDEYISSAHSTARMAVEEWTELVVESIVMAQNNRQISQYGPKQWQTAGLSAQSIGPCCVIPPPLPPQRHQFALVSSSTRINTNHRLRD